MANGGSEFRLRLVRRSGLRKLPVGTCVALLEDAYIDGTLFQACELQRSAYTCPLRTNGRRGGNPISGGRHR